MARFDELAGRDGLDGLDTSVDPPWLLVGMGSSWKRIRLREGTNWSVTNSDPAVVRMAVQAPALRDREIKFMATGVGESTIEARSPDGRRGIQLKVYTRPRREHTIAFYFVRDGADHRTQRPRAEVGDILRRLRDIYLPQANVDFRSVDVQDVSVPGDLGSNVDIPAQGAGQEFTAIQNATRPEQVLGLRALAGGSHARVRVHFVWSIRGPRRHGDTEGVGLVGGDSLLVEDRVADIGLVLAHEVGHCLRLDHPSVRRRGWLMNATTQSYGPTIPKQHVDILNPGS